MSESIELMLFGAAASAPGGYSIREMTLPFRARASWWSAALALLAAACSETSPSQPGNPSSDSALSSLELEGVELEPPFAHDHTEYRAELSLLQQRVRLLARARDPEAEVVVEATGASTPAEATPGGDGASTDLQPGIGTRTVTVRVRAPSGQGSRYTIVIERGGNLWREAHTLLAPAPADALPMSRRQTPERAICSESPSRSSTDGSTPFAYHAGERPTRRAVLGGVIAVGAAGLFAVVRYRCANAVAMVRGISSPIRRDPDSDQIPRGRHRPRTRRRRCSRRPTHSFS